MFNDLDQHRARYVWRRALRQSRDGHDIDSWRTNLSEEYGLDLVMIEGGIAGVRMSDPDKFMLFRMRYL
jgi:hypothetical protein